MHRLSSLYTRTASAERAARRPRCVESSVTPYVYIGPDTAIGRGGRWSCRVAPPRGTGASEARHASMHRLSSLYTRTASAERAARHPGGVESSVTPYVYIGPDTAIGREGRWSRGVAPPWATGASEARHASMHRLSSLYTRTASAERAARHPGGVESSVTPYVYIGPDTAIGRGGRWSRGVARPWAV
jgi:hypothetical protein